MNPIELPSVIQELFDLKWYTATILLALIAVSIFLYKAARNVRWNSRMIANAAMCIAISYVLSCIKLYRFPQGGSITPASMLPIVMFSVACGTVPGVLVGCAYGLISLLQDPYVIHPIQMLVDYPLAFGVIALGAIAKFIPIKGLRLPIAVLIGAFGRYCMAVLSGTVFFAEYAPAEQTAFVYSIVYNFSYLLWDTVICVVIASLPGLYRIVDIIRGNVQLNRS